MTSYTITTPGLVLSTILYSAARLQWKQPQSATVNSNFRGRLISQSYATRENLQKLDTHEKLVFYSSLWITDLLIVGKHAVEEVVTVGVKWPGGCWAKLVPVVWARQFNTVIFHWLKLTRINRRRRRRRPRRCPRRLRTTHHTAIYELSWCHRLLDYNDAKCIVLTQGLRLSRHSGIALFAWVLMQSGNHSNSLPWSPDLTQINTVWWCHLWGVDWIHSRWVE